MTEWSLTIDELLKRLKQEPEAARALISEIVAQLAKEYLTIEELAKRLSWEERTIKNKMESGIFQKWVRKSRMNAYFFRYHLGKRLSTYGCHSSG